MNEKLEILQKEQKKLQTVGGIFIIGLALTIGVILWNSILGIVLFGVMILVYVFYLKKAKKDYKQHIKQTMLEEGFRSSLKQISYMQKDGISAADLQAAHFLPMERQDSTIVRDTVKGTYQGCPVTVSEITTDFNSIKEKKNGSERQIIDFLSGSYFEIRLPAASDRDFIIWKEGDLPELTMEHYFSEMKQIDFLPHAALFNNNAVESGIKKESVGKTDVQTTEADAQTTEMDVRTAETDRQTTEMDVETAEAGAQTTEMDAQMAEADLAEGEAAENGDAEEVDLDDVKSFIRGKKYARKEKAALPEAAVLQKNYRLYIPKTASPDDYQSQSLGQKGNFSERLLKAFRYLTEFTPGHVAMQVQGQYLRVFIRNRFMYTIDVPVRTELTTKLITYNEFSEIHYLLRIADTFIGQR